MTGEVYDYVIERRRLERRGCRFVGDTHAELLLHGYSTEGTGYFRQVHGSFAIAIWDNAKRRLCLISDRFGSRPIYFSASADRLLFASRIRPLLGEAGVSTRLSELGVAQFFGLGHFLAEDTLYRDVRLLPAAACLTFDPSGARADIERYWDLAEAFGPSAHRNGDAALEQIDAAFGVAMERCLGGVSSLGLSLSGGLDSRTILAAVPQEMPLDCVTLGMPGSIDLRYAASLARVTSRPLHTCLLDDDYLDQFEGHLRRVVRLTDGQYVSSAIVAPSLDLYRRLGVRTLLRGHGGELMHLDKAYGYSLPEQALSADRPALKSLLYQGLAARLSSGPGNELFRPPYRDSIEREAHASFEGCFAEAAAIQPSTHAVPFFFIRHFLRRATSLSMSKFGTVAEPRLPFVDPDLIAALMAAPATLKFGDQIQTWLLRRRARKLLEVPNANTGAPLGAGPAHRRFSQARLRLLGRLGVPGYQPYERLGLWLRRELQPTVRRLLLNPRCYDRGVLEPRALKQVVEDHVDGRMNHTYLILAMLVFELGQRELVDTAA